MPKKRETMKDLRELGSLAEFKKMGTDSDFNSILQKTETQTTINTEVGPDKLFYSQVWEKNMTGTSIQKIKPKALKIFSNMEKDDLPYRALCKRKTVFARKIKEFSDSEDEAKRSVPF